MSNYNYYSNEKVSFNKFMTGTFTNLSIGLIITAAVSLLVSIFFGEMMLMSSFTPFIFIACAILELVCAFSLSHSVFTMTKAKTQMLFIAYSVLTGITFSFVPLVYDGGTLALAFLMTATVFICMSIIGHTTNMDLSKFGPYFTAGLITMIITTLLNVFFFRSSMVDMMLNYAGIVIFLGLIAYDMQMLKHMYNEAMYDDNMLNKLSILGAFELYLDFINLFIRILSILSRRDD